MCLHAFHTPLALCEKPGFLWLMSLLHRIVFHMPSEYTFIAASVIAVGPEVLMSS